MRRDDGKGRDMRDFVPRHPSHQTRDRLLIVGTVLVLVFLAYLTHRHLQRANLAGSEAGAMASDPALDIYAPPTPAMLPDVVPGEPLPSDSPGAVASDQPPPLKSTASSW